MDNVLGAFAFAGIIVAHVAAVVAMHKATRDESGTPFRRGAARESHGEGACAEGRMGSSAPNVRRLTPVAAALPASVLAGAQDAAGTHATEPAHRIAGREREALSPCDRAVLDLVFHTSAL